MAWNVKMGEIGEIDLYFIKILLFLLFSPLADCDDEKCVMIF